MASFVSRILSEIGEDPDREGLRRTPERVAEALRFLTSGNRRTVEEVLNGAVFQQEVDEIVLVKDVEVYSLCEHHLLPFTGKAHVAYLPSGRILGLSKIPRIVDLYARRLQVQERLTMEIAKAIEAAVRPRGVGVVVEASHLCMMMRGVEKQHSVAVTSCMLGRFRSDPKTRGEFLTLVYGRGATPPLGG
ncbi:MAG TPA: GTP cyclohydrolase I FolE [Planctomycetota bacterium]|nr:GTP cyclohydrolase I FolE [Planctomycetota bacterium]